MGRVGSPEKKATAGTSATATRRRKGATEADDVLSHETDGSAALFSLDRKLDDFYWVHDEEPHRSRRMAMLKAHPELKELMRHEPLTKWIVAAEVLAQFGLAWWLSSTGRGLTSWEFWVLAYFVGGTLTASLVLSIHEITHYLAFKAFLPNKILACIANLPIVIPFCVEFKRYHMDHHRFQGVDGIDGDLPSILEAKLLNNLPGKFFFCAVQILFYALRPKLVATARTFRMPETTKEWIFSWYTMNFVIQIISMLLTLKYLGLTAIFYLGASVLLGGSLHPMAGHFIAEHYVTTPGQETYSYYGWLNVFGFNVGYHNEHHDLPNIPWTLLPEVRKIAPEFYDDLAIVPSWPGSLYDFITKPGMGPYSRIKRKETAKTMGDTTVVDPQ